MNVLTTLSRSHTPAGSRFRRFAALLLLATFAAGAAWATDDPPGRIGRIAKTTGQIWLFDAETQDWMETAVNQPLTTGDRLSVGSDARAVVQIGSTTVRIDTASELEFQRIDDSKIALQVHNGSIGIQVVAPEVVAEIEFMTGEAYFFPRRTGHYRIDRRDGITQAGVWNGELSVAGPGLNQTLTRGQRLELWQQGAATRFAWHSNEADDFSDWVVRSQDENARSVTRNYVSPEMTGWEDLDRHGRWDNSNDYGPIWYPSVGVDWAPFRFGRWTWVRPWGWTWIDSSPWGFAPFHYGRWIQIGGRWCWSPGTRTIRPVYAPAMVTWPGTVGVNISLRIGSGPPTGWIPLSPYEPYRPYYRSTPNYTTVINQTHVHIHRAPDRDRDGTPDWRDNDRGRGPDRDGRREGSNHSAQYRNAPVAEAIAKPDDRYGSRTRPSPRNEQRGTPRPETNGGPAHENTLQRPNGRTEWNRTDDDNSERRRTPRERYDGRDSNDATPRDGNRRGNAPAPAPQPGVTAAPHAAQPATPATAPPSYAPPASQTYGTPDSREAEREAQRSRFDGIRMQRPDASRDELQGRRTSGRERNDEREQLQESPRPPAQSMERQTYQAPAQPMAAPAHSPAPAVAPMPAPAPRAEKRRNEDDDDRRDRKRGRNDKENER